MTSARSTGSVAGDGECRARKSLNRAKSLPLKVLARRSLLEFRFDYYYKGEGVHLQRLHSANRKMDAFLKGTLIVIVSGNKTEN